MRLHNIFPYPSSPSVCGHLLTLPLLGHWTLTCTMVLFTEPESSWSDHFVITDLSGVMRIVQPEILGVVFMEWCKYGSQWRNETVRMTTIHTKQFSSREKPTVLSWIFKMDPLVYCQPCLESFWHATFHELLFSLCPFCIPPTHGTQI